MSVFVKLVGLWSSRTLFTPPDTIIFLVMQRIWSWTKKKPNCVAVHWKHLPARHHNIFINTIWSLCKYTPYIHFTSWWRIVLLSFMFCRCRHNFIIYSITSAWDLIKWLNFGCSPWREAGSESQWERRQIGLDYIASAETETSQLIPLSLFGLFFCVIGGGVKLCAA